MTIWKYSLYADVVTTLKLPYGAVPISAQAQHGRIVLWALVDPTQTTTEARKFAVYGTGFTMPDRAVGVDYEDIMKYLGTVQLGEGVYVGHVFEDMRVDK